MYSDYLDNFKRLIGLLGEDDATQLVRSQCQSVQDKINTQYICSRRLNIDYRKKFFQSGPLKNTAEIPPQGKVLKAEWISSILKKEPMLFVLVFNFSRPLDPIEKFEDRLAIANTDINNAKQYLRMQNQKHVVLNYLVITGGQGSQVMADKTKEYLKITDRSLQITTLESLKTPNEIKRIRSNWLYFWDKAADDRYKRRQRKLEDTLKDQGKLNCHIKLAVLADIIGRENTLNLYEGAYNLCKKLHQTFEKARCDDLEILIPLYQYRRLADVLLFRVMNTLAKNKASQCLSRVVIHFAELSTRRQYPDFLSQYADSEEINWKAQFLETALKQLLLLAAIVSDKDRQKFTEYLNALLSYRMGLVNIKFKPIQQKLKSDEPYYFGRLSYQLENNQKLQDLKETRLVEFSQNRQTYLMDSINLIAWVRQIPTLLRPYELQILRLTLLRLYLASAMIDEALNLYNEIVDFYITRKDFFVLNHLLKQIQSYLQNDQQRNSMVKFHLISLRIADNFGSKQHIEEFVKHLKETLAHMPASSKTESIPHPLNRHSLLIRAKADMGSKVLSLAEKRIIKLELDINPCLNGFFETVDVQFNIDTKKTFYGLKLTPQIDLELEPSDFTLQEEMLKIQTITMKSSRHHVHAVRSTGDIDYKKQSRIFISMPIPKPQIIVKPVHGNTQYFVNEIFPVSIQVLNKQTSDTKLHIKLIFSQQASSPTRSTEPQTKPNECFLSLTQKVNLLNVQSSTKMSQNTPLLFYLKFPFRGDKRINIAMGILSEKMFKNSRGEERIIKKSHKHSTDMSFSVIPLLTLRKKLKIHTSEILGKRIRFDNEVWEVPRRERVFLHFSLRTAESVQITSVKQEQVSEDIQFLRPINIHNVYLQKNSMFKAVSIIQIQTQSKQLLKLPPIVIHWRRPNSPIQNTLVDLQQRILPIDKLISVQIKQIDHLRKGQIGQVHYKLINYQEKQMNVRVEALENETMMLVGKSRRDLVLSEMSNMILSFQVMPLVTGEVVMPELLVKFIKDKEVSEVKLVKRHTTLAI